MDALLASPSWPFAVLFLGIVAVVVMISVFRIQAFVALILTAIFVGLISHELPKPPNKPDQLDIVTAIELPMQEFGITAGKIAWVIALAAMIGTAMMKSGAAEKIVNWLLQLLKEKRAAIALLISGFILSIPVFFDTVFFLLIPLAIALAMKTGRNFVLYVVAIAGGAAITHSLVPPTPGPLIMAENMQLDVGITILSGLSLGILPAIAVLFWAKFLNKKLNLPVRVSLDKKDETKELPSLFLSVLPVLVPIVLISIASITEVQLGRLPALIAFWGNKNIAMALGTIIALWLWAKQENLSANDLWKAASEPIQIAGMIILITSAGGAFGAMIKHSGIGEAITIATADFSISYIILGWLIAAVMKTAQGSSTVSMITSSSIMYALIGASGGELAYHPMYILMAIGFGSLFISWMNDSGFWVVAKMSGFTEKEGIQTWTTTLAVISFVGLFQILLLSLIFPFN